MVASKADSVVRALTDDGAFRIITTCTTETVRGAIRAQEASGTTAGSFGELLTGAILIRETMAPTLRVQAILQATEGSGALVADSHPGGMTRGLVNKSKTHAEVIISEGALLQVLRTMPSGAVQQGVVELPEKDGISGGVMMYMQTSEQVYSIAAVGCVFENGELRYAGGYIIQVLPEVHNTALRHMTERLEKVAPIAELLSAARGDPSHLLKSLLADEPYSIVEDSEVRFGCNCDVVRVVSALATLGEQEILTIIKEGKPLHVECDYCGTAYEVGTEQLRTLVMKH